MDRPVGRVGSNNFAKLAGRVTLLTGRVGSQNLDPRLQLCEGITTVTIPWAIKTCHTIFVHNFKKCWPILKKFSLMESAVNLQQSSCHIFCCTLNMSLHVARLYCLSRLPRRRKGGPEPVWPLLNPRPRVRETFFKIQKTRY